MVSGEIKNLRRLLIQQGPKEGMLETIRFWVQKIDRDYLRLREEGRDT